MRWYLVGTQATERLLITLSGGARQKLAAGSWIAYDTAGNVAGDGASEEVCW